MKEIEVSAPTFCHECAAQYVVTYDPQLVPEKAMICCPWCSAADISDHHKENGYSEENDD